MVVEDSGLPFDFKKVDTEKESSLGIMLMKAFADEIRFLNLGRGGKRVEIVKNLPYKDVDAYLTEDEKKSAPPTEPAKQDIAITIRLMRPDDSVDLSRCVYRCYGYTYANGDVYFPDRVRELLESGLLISHVALNPEGEVIGHLAIRKEHPGNRVGERGQAVVDPRYRGHGLLNKLLSAVIEHARGIGMYGTYSEGVTVHTFSQKAAIAAGGRETGILLGFTPATMFFKKIQEGERQQRQAIVLIYTRLNDEPQRDVYPPFHHQGIIRRIYEMNSYRRNIVSAADVKEQAGLPAICAGGCFHSDRRQPGLHAYQAIWSRPGRAGEIPPAGALPATDRLHLPRPALIPACHAEVLRQYGDAGFLLRRNNTGVFRRRYAAAAVPQQCGRQPGKHPDRHGFRQGAAQLRCQSHGGIADGAGRAASSHMV